MLGARASHAVRYQTGRKVRMFGLWGKATKPPIEDDNPLVAEARAELATIRQWDLPTRTTFSVFLATHWREFVDTFGGPDAFARVSRIQQLSFFKSIYEHWLFSATRLIG